MACRILSLVRNTKIVVSGKRIGTTGTSPPLYRKSLTAIRGGARRLARPILAIIVLAMTVLPGGQPATANAADKNKEHPAYEIPRSEVRTISSKKLGRSYDLYIKLPPRYGDERMARRTYPLILLTDGPFTFQVAAGVTHMPMNLGGIDHAIIVGLGYARGEGGMKSRSRDLTPVPLGPEARYEHGGAEKTLSFFETELLPLLEAEYRIDPARRTLVGQSYGGLFGAYALLTRPVLFSGYILTSPSLWFANRAIFDIEEAKADARTEIPAKVYFAIGETEGPATRPGHDMVSQQTMFASTLRRRGIKGLEVRDEIIAGATHQTTFPIGLTRGLMWLHPGPDVHNGGATWYGE